MNKDRFLEILSDGIDGVKYKGIFYNVDFADEDEQVIDLVQTDDVDTRVSISYDTLLADKELKTYRWEEIK